MYPKIRLTRRIRRLIMGILIANFFVISPVLLLYTGGYRFNWQQWKLQQTGVISIDIEPTDAAVYLNNIKINKKIPIRLTDCAPGLYSIKFSKPGYQDWQKDITVESKKTTYLKDITLFKNNLPVLLQKDDKNEINNVFFSVDGRYALLAVTNKKNVYEIRLLNTNNKSLSTLLQVESSSQPQIFWSPYNNFALIQAQEKNNVFSLHLFDVSQVDNISSFSLVAPLKNWQWSKNNFLPTIYFEQVGRIKMLAENIQDLYASPAAPWYVDDNENLWYFNKASGELISNAGEHYSFQSTETINKIISLTAQQLILQGENSIFVTKKTTNELSPTSLPTQNFYYNLSNKEWLSWSPWELWSIYRNGEAALLTRTSEKIVKVVPLDNFGVLLLHVDNGLKAFNPGYYLTQTLLNDAAIKKTTADLQLRKIFFWGAVGQVSGIFELDY